VAELVERFRALVSERQAA